MIYWRDSPYIILFELNSVFGLITDHRISKYGEIILLYISCIHSCLKLTPFFALLPWGMFLIRFWFRRILIGITSMLSCNGAGDITSRLVLPQIGFVWTQTIKVKRNKPQNEQDETDRSWLLTLFWNSLILI